jgi:hypothetical protein
MNEYIKEAFDAIVECNCNCESMDAMLHLSTDGYSWAVLVDDLVLCSSESGDRACNWETDEYEPIKETIKRRLIELSGELANLSGCL